MARSLRTRSRVSRPRRKLIWARSADGIVVPDDSAPSTQNRFPLSTFEVTFGANLIGCTIMRVRGVITAALVGDTIPNQSYAAIRFAARVTDHADLSTSDYADGAMYGNQAHADWFLFEPFMLDASSQLTSGEDPEATTATQTRMVDVRARRKIDELDQTVEILIGRPVQSSTAPPFNIGDVRVRWDLSFLVMLP